MQKIRAEKEFIVRWSGILTNGQPDSLEGRDLSLYLINPYGAESRQEMAVEGNTVTFRVYADTCKAHGQYRLKLYENKGKVGQTVLDQCEGFCIVATTCQEGGITQGLDLDTIELSGGDMAIGIQGRSAYEIAVANGFEGTEAEWLASLKGEKGDIGPQGPEGEKGDKGDKGDIGEAFTYSDFTPEQIAELQRPASEAAQLANQAASKANAAAESATRAAQTATQTETTIKQAEALRVTAEKQRETNESEREQAETSRKQAESGRVTAEQGRVSAEQGRVSAESGRVSAEQQRVAEFATLKQESETATANANEAAEKANEAAEGIDEKIAGKQDIFEECEGLLIENSTIKNVDDIINHLNKKDALSILFFVRPTVNRFDWYRYISMCKGTNSSNLSFLRLGYEGSFLVFEPSAIYAVNKDFQKYMKSYKQIICVDRVEGKFIAYNEIGKYVEEQLDRFKQPDFFSSIVLNQGDAKNAFYEWVIFNFNLDRILRFNKNMLSYLRNSQKSGILPTNLIHKSYEDYIKEKYMPSGYPNKWTKERKEDGYYYISTTEESDCAVGANGFASEIEYKSCQVIITLEVISGSVKVKEAGYFGSSDYEIYEIKDLTTGEKKEKLEELQQGTYQIIADYWTANNQGVNISSVKVPCMVKCIKHIGTPYAAMIQLKGDKLYGTNKFYDGVTNQLRELSVKPVKGYYPFNIARYGTTAPSPSEPPRYIGEKYYNTATGDIYEAGDLTTFKKLNDA